MKYLKWPNLVENGPILFKVWSSSFNLLLFGQIWLNMGQIEIQNGEIDLKYLKWKPNLVENGQI